MAGAEEGPACQGLNRVIEEGKGLPEAYMWKEEDRPQLCYDDFQDEEQPPIIDLSSQQPAEAVISACREWGVFQVVNHGVPPKLVAAARSNALALFALPQNSKLRALRLPGGMSGYGTTRMASFFDSLMWSEAFTLLGSPEPNIADFANKLWSGNEAEEQQQRSFFCECLREYEAAMRQLATRLALMVLGGLGMQEQQSQALTSSFWGWIHMNYYPPCPSPLEAMGLGSHTDSSCLTIMHQGDVAGLQLRRHGRWIAVKAHRNAFVIQVGDMLQVMSNAYFGSVVHRAVVNDKMTRLSLVYFLSPPPTASITPLSSSSSSGGGSHQRLYRCFTWNDYLQAKAKYFMDTLQHFEIAATAAENSE